MFFKYLEKAIIYLQQNCLKIAQRGHAVTFVKSYPEITQIKNFKEIPVEFKFI
jgi:hypothetical protein